MRHTLLVLLLVVGLETQALAGWDQGVAAFDRGDYATAFEEFEPLAQAGDADAQYKLGVLYAEGLGVSADGKYYALIIGNDEYEYFPNLKTAVHDAQAFAAVLTERYTFKKDAVILLINATRKEILRTLSQLRRTLGSEDRLLFYFAGYDDIDVYTGEPFWHPADAEPGKTFTWISNTEIKRFLLVTAAKHVLIISSVHHSWGFRGPSPTIESANEGTALYRSDTLKSRKVLLSGDGGTLPYAHLETQSGFGKSFIKILRENTRPYLTTFQLFDRTVKAMSDVFYGTPELRIIPDTGDEGGDFIFVLKSGL